MSIPARQVLVPLGTGLLLWLLIVRQVSPNWTVIPQYSFGWFVPLLGAWILWQRWKARPNPSPPRGITLVVAVAAVLLAVLAPIRLIQEANRDWQFVSWALAFSVTGLILLAWWWAGGTPWARHFLFPTLFPLVAVPWPSKLEQPLLQGLMRWVAALGAELLTAFDIPAIAHGSVVEISRGIVGIDEACSGIQSLQASVMTALFLGELFWLNGTRRVVLFGFAALWAFLCNLGRTLFLCVTAYQSGFESLEKLHSTAGFGAMILAYVGIVAASLGLARSVKPIPEPKQHTPARSIPMAACLAVAIWLLLSEMLTFGWYRARGGTLAPNPGWDVKIPGDLPGARSREFSGAERTTLRFNEADLITWVSPEQHRWYLSYIRWNAGNLAVDTARNHNPMICLPNAGYELQKEFPVRTFRIGERNVPFQIAYFEHQGRPVVTLFCYWDDVVLPLVRPWSREDWSARARLRNVREGRRTGGLRMLSASAFGTDHVEGAVRDFQEILDRIAVHK